MGCADPPSTRGPAHPTPAAFLELTKNRSGLWVTGQGFLAALALALTALAALADAFLADFCSRKIWWRTDFTSASTDLSSFSLRVPLCPSALVCSWVNFPVGNSDVTSANSARSASVANGQVLRRAAAAAKAASALLVSSAAVADKAAVTVRSAGLPLPPAAAVVVAGSDAGAGAGANADAGAERNGGAPNPLRGEAGAAALPPPSLAGRGRRFAPLVLSVTVLKYVGGIRPASVLCVIGMCNRTSA